MTELFLTKQETRKLLIMLNNLWIIDDNKEAKILYDDIKAQSGED